jgi:hypothetical protein
VEDTFDGRSMHADRGREKLHKSLTLNRLKRIDSFVRFGAKKTDKLQDTIGLLANRDKNYQMESSSWSFSGSKGRLISWALGTYLDKIHN